MSVRKILTLCVGMVLLSCGREPDTTAKLYVPTVDHTKFAGKLVVYKHPNCGCCAAWVKHMESNGFEVEVFEDENTNLIHKRFGVPKKLHACHTATYGNLIIEGHVPAADLINLLKTPSAEAGLIAVPGMPVGSPGMETGEKPESYVTLIQTKDGSIRSFKTH